jgi:hypothetical protein
VVVRDPTIRPSAYLLTCQAIYLLNKVHELAEKRLELEECRLPGGRLAGQADRVYDPKARWTVIWDGYDVVERLLHSLDFLRDKYAHASIHVLRPVTLPPQ